MLTELEVRRAKPRDKDYKLADSNALYAFIASSGRKTWRWKYRFAGKERQLVFGAWPEISLKRARELRDDARQILRSNRDPGQEPQGERTASVDAEQSDHSFEIYARAWHAKERPRWKTVHARQSMMTHHRRHFRRNDHQRVCDATIDLPADGMIGGGQDIGQLFEQLRAIVISKRHTRVQLELPNLIVTPRDQQREAAEHH